MWASFALTVTAGIVVLAIGFAGGYTYRWYRSRIKASLETHTEEWMSKRSIHVSITNHGNSAITVDSWTVHMPMDDVLPGVGAKLRELAESDEQTSTRKRLRTVSTVARRIWSRLYRRGRIGIADALSREFARSMLHEMHLRHQLLDPGSTQRIEPGDSAVRTFPRISANPQEPKIAFDAQNLTIIPSCHVVGQRRRTWGWPTILGGGPIPTVVRLYLPRADKEDW